MCKSKSYGVTMRIAESLRTKCANKQELAIVFLEVLSSGFATARPDSGDDGRNGAIHDDKWSPLIGIYMPAKLVFTMETFEHDDVEEEALAEAVNREEDAAEAVS